MYIIADMSLQHPKIASFEKRLKTIFDMLDHELELKYKGRFALHPARPKRGTTADPSADGLFDIGATFTAGFGSEHGRGYTIQARIATLGQTDAKTIQTVEKFIVKRLNEELPREFPERKLQVLRDGNVYKIVGDLGIKPAKSAIATPHDKSKSQQGKS